MSELFDFKASSKNYAVMGNPVKHSRSPQIHSLFAQQCQIDLEYDLIQVDVGGFDQAVSHFMAHGGSGLNITIPFKVEAWQLCNKKPNRTSIRAIRAESVNTLKFEEDGSIFGDNTDGIGIVRDIENNIGYSIKGSRILIIGAGGAVRGILGPLLDKQPRQVTITNRTIEKARQLVQHFNNTTVISCGLDKKDDAEYDLIINGSATTDLDRTLPAVHQDCIRSDTVVYDMRYGQQPTVFMKWALVHGAQSAYDGLGMLVEQAAESFFLWHNQMPDSLPVIKALRQS